MSPISSTRTWLDAVGDFAAEHSVPAWVLDDLGTFATGFPRGGPPAPPEMPWPGDFAELESWLGEGLDQDELSGLLSEEVEGWQPGIFARRAAAVEQVLRDQATPSARVLRAGLRLRLDGICKASPPRLRRVRALADFYYSLSARSSHPEWDALERYLERRAANPEWRTVRPGLEHALLDGAADGMPVHVNVLRIDPELVAIDVTNLHADSRSGRPWSEILAKRGALAAISGGYFLYSEDDIEAPSRRHDPVGLLLSEGTVHGPPVFRRATVLATENRFALQRIGISDVEMRIGGHAISAREIWNRARGRVGPDADSVAVLGTRVHAVGRELAIPLNGFVAVLAPDHGTTPRAGDEVSYGAPVIAEEAARTGISGGPLLVEDGRPVLNMRAEDFWGTAPPITFSQDETGDRNLLARLAVGIDAEGRLLAAAIDGRNVQRALGMTLGETARLMIQLGCTRAANMDGGSSKRMILEGEVLDLPSTEIVAGESAEERVRPLHTAVLFRERSRSGPRPT